MPRRSLESDSWQSTAGSALYSPLVTASDSVPEPQDARGFEEKMRQERFDENVGPTAPSLAQSESKTMFFRRLGLDERNVMHRHLYSLMKGEASAGWCVKQDESLPQLKLAYTSVPYCCAITNSSVLYFRHRMVTTRDSLLASARQDPAVEPPYAFCQMDEEALQREVREIYRRAKPETRILYDLGREVYLGKEENWIIRWLLWHAFRYRDDRNRYPRRTTRPDEIGTPSNTVQVLEHTPGSPTPIPQSVGDDSTQHPTASSPGSSRSSSWYDPVRGVYRT